MSHKIIFVRIRPSTIRVQEQYTYYADISGNRHTERCENPTGLIEITIPYDGEELFNAQVIEDLER